MAMERIMIIFSLLNLAVILLIFFKFPKRIVLGFIPILLLHFAILFFIQGEALLAVVLFDIFAQMLLMVLGVIGLCIAKFTLKETLKFITILSPILAMLITGYIFKP